MEVHDNPGAWTHVVATVAYTTQRLYINGEESATSVLGWEP